MSYLVEYKGVTINVQTLDEAAELARKLAMDDNSKEVAPELADEETTKKRIRGLPKYLANREKQVLTALAEHDGALETDQLAKAAGIPTQELKYALRKIHARAKKNGIDGKLLIDSKPDYKQRPVKSTYTMTEAVRQVIMSVLAKHKQNEGNTE